MKLFRSSLLPLALLLCRPGAAVAAAPPEPLDAVEKAAGDWVKVRTETVRLETDWALQKDLLESTVNALAERAQAAEDQRERLKAKTAQDRTDLAELQARNKLATDSMQAAGTRLQDVAARLAQLRPSLPPRLSEALELPYRSLGNRDLGPAERMQVVMTILNRCAQFNRIVTCDEEVLAIPGEPGAKALAVMYWGLSHGYALDRATGRAWLGAPGPGGWNWSPHPEAAQQVAALIAVHNDKAEPEFVPVPAQLAHVSPTR